MRIIRSPNRLPPDCALCLGAFDGLHRGHVALFEHAVDVAEHIAIGTFDPHPSRVLAPHRPTARIQTTSQTRRVARHLGVDALAIIEFTRQVSRLPPREFIDTHIIDGLRPTAVIVGQDFRYGADRQGTHEDLSRQLAAANIRCEALPLLDVRGETVSSSAMHPPTDAVHQKVSSTAIREFVAAGEVERAGAALGRLHALEGTVVRGDGRGKSLGFATANLEHDGLVPARGVYSTYLTLLDDAGQRELEFWPCVTNVGENPTFAAAETRSPRRVEVHCFDRDLGNSLYDRRVEVHFCQRIRDERTFDGPAELVTAIRADIELARAQLEATGSHRRYPAPLRSANPE